MLIFFDTEFTSLDWPAECLSIGLVTDDGRHWRYLERSDVDRTACSDFVISTVLPLFGQIPRSVMPYAQFGAALRAWLERLPGELQFACDSPINFRFLHWILEGQLPERCHPHPVLLHFEDPGAWAEALEAYFAARPRRRRHHALADAYACREAFHQRTALHDRRAGVPPD